MTKATRKRAHARLDRLLDLWASGLNDRQVSQKTGRSQSTVCSIRNELGISPNRKHGAELTLKRIPRRAFVLALRENGLTLAAIGRELGVTRQRVEQILKGGR